MNNRLKQFLAAENITQSQFADKIEVVRASVSHVLSGRNNPSYEFIKAIIANYPSLNIEWLMFGKGKMYKDSETSSHQMEYTATNRQDELFPVEIADETFSESKNSEPQNEFLENSADSTCSTQSYETIKIVEKQRNVKKILILFDDGTFQEM